MDGQSGAAGIGGGESAPVSATADGAACLLVDLRDCGLVAVRGSEAESFLQGQFTCDMRRVTSQRSALGAYLSPKGRVLASFRILRFGDGYLLRMQSSVLHQTVRRLRMFVLRAQVDIEDVSDALVIFGVRGTDADSALRRAFGDPPDTIDEVKQSGRMAVVRVPGATPRFEVLGAPEETMELLDIPGGKHPPGGMPGSCRRFDLVYRTSPPKTATLSCPRCSIWNLSMGSASPRDATRGRRWWRGPQYLGKGQAEDVSGARG